MCVISFAISKLYHGLLYAVSENANTIIIILIIGLALFITWKVYLEIYYKSENFKQLKDTMDEYVIDCNDLNQHITRLEQTYSTVNKTNYGTAQLIDKSQYNYKRKEQLKAKKSEYIHDCSASVCKNAEMQPFKYLCKYFNITANEETLYTFENVLNNFSAAEEGKQLLNETLEDIKKSIEYDVPPLIRILDMKKLMLKLGFEKIEFNTLCFPTYMFRYISPGGNKTTNCTIKLDIDQLNNFIEYLATVIKFKKSVAGQRALMTTKLRESIKERDNYTCQECGVSIYDEEHLLLEIDHILPLAKGGLSTIENLQTLCWRCNRTKGAKIIN